MYSLIEGQNTNTNESSSLNQDGQTIDDVNEDEEKLAPTSDFDDDVNEDEDDDEVDELLNLNEKAVVKTKKLDLSAKLNELNSYISDDFSKTIMDIISEFNKKHGNILYDSDNDTPYVLKIKQFSSIWDLGNPKYSDELDFIENIIIKGLDIPNDALSEHVDNEFCASDLNIDILLMLAIFYNNNNSEFDKIKDQKLIYVNKILNRLGKYFPDIFQKILNVMKLCNPDSTRYIILENIYSTMFKYNNTNVNLNFSDIFKRFFEMLQGRKTIEIIIIIICIAFVMSKIFDMFRVKVDV